MKQSQSVQVTSAPSITVAEGQPTVTNSHVPWVWDTKYVGNSARMALTAKALCKTAGAPLPAGQPPAPYTCYTGLIGLTEIAGSLIMEPIEQHISA